MNPQHASRNRVRWIYRVFVPIALVAMGTTLVVVATQGPRNGPSIAHPIGVTSAASVPTAGSTFTVSPNSSVPNLGATLSLASSTTPAPTASPAILRTPLAAVARSRPVHLTIPAIRLSEPLSVLGLNHNGTVSVPTNFYVPGWYKFGPAPGQLGSAVILGHVDSFRGPAAFFYLRNLRPGNRVNVTLADGRQLQFAVIGLRMYTKDNFPDHLVYGPRSYSALQLVTCGGVFDARTGHYLSNLVVYTELVRR